MFDLPLVQHFYGSLPARVAGVRRRLARPLTLTEKILYSHLDRPERQELERGKSFLLLRPDRVAMQDATAQMAILQFVSCGRPRVAVAATVHCDHLVVAQKGAREDVTAALKENQEVYDFLSTAARKFGMGFWRPGAGIIHQVVLENYAFPGGLLIGTDSHTPNAGGMGMAAVGVGGADAVDAMAGLPWEVLCPRILGVRLTGRLSGWVSAKDVIQELLRRLTCSGGTNKVIEYFGPGVAGLSLTGRCTITNMGAELGATTSLFPCDEQTAAYLRATRRAEVAEWALGVRTELCADAEVAQAPETFYDELLEVDLSQIEPLLAGPHTPDLVHPASALPAVIKEAGYPDHVSACLVGSCTNSSYEDLRRAAHVARQAATLGLKARCALLVTPGSDHVYATAERDGLLEDLRRIGGMVMANVCGPCIGQWKRTDVPATDEAAGKPNVIVTTFNRNFRARNDGLKSTLAFIASPELAVAKALSGRLSFNPVSDTLETPQGKAVKLAPPESPSLPPGGFVFDDRGYQAPAEDGAGIELRVSAGSERLQLLAPFPAWDGRDILEARVLVKVQGKCTTDHISPAGRWLRYRGHLDRISDNLLSGAVNAFTGQTGTGTNLLSGQKDQPLAAVARAYKAEGVPWIVVGDQNYGEGSSREHAALEPRHLGGRAVLVRSFARIHETNLKKQGLLALVFADPADYDRIREDDRVSILGVGELRPGRPVTVRVRHSDGTAEEFAAVHSYNGEQTEWFRAGGALNLVRRLAGADGPSGRRAAQ